MSETVSGPGAASKVMQPYVSEPQPGLTKSDSILGRAMVTMEDIMALFTDLARGKFEQMEKKSAISRDAQDQANQVEAAMANLFKDGDKTTLPASVVEYMRKNNILVDNKTIDELLASKSEIAPLLEKMNQKIQTLGPEGEECKYWHDVVDYLEARNINIEGGRRCVNYIWNLPEVKQRNGQRINLEHMKVIRQALINSAPPAEKTEFTKGDLMKVKSALESVSTRASDFVQQNQLKLQQMLQNFNTAVTMTNSLQSMNAESTKSIAQSIR
ncbi:MAG: type III secretion system translocon protein, EspA family [Glomeribacter sp. 1016415]|nr:type III secretion system translocon protein, EspA family [Glomeribacter sp. 1016415]